MSNATTPYSKSCEASMKLLGDFWTLSIINALEPSTMRFCELQRELNNLNPVTLTSRLKKLEHAGIVARTELSEGISVNYSLTSLGKEAYSVVKALNRFATKSADLHLPSLSHVA
ncbi:MAG: hypothetical protein JWN33_500 [Candidatus Saccharibacteria bacterium]|nr:hypothetical protein [Candidatus Saccharibacteria bacterium]